VTPQVEFSGKCDLLHEASRHLEYLEPNSHAGVEGNK